MLSIDLNCDMGEGMSSDESIFPLISSANIACGYHAGDPDTMRKSVALALRHGVAIGAHPSYPDRTHFGRIDLLAPTGHTLTLTDLPALLLDQLDLLQQICREFGAGLHHVKPHGALYNRAAIDGSVSEIICQIIREFDPVLLLYGLRGSQLEQAALRQGLHFVSEVFADRTYRPDGTLTPRTEPGALIEDPDKAAKQAITLIGEGNAGTICLHGDGNHALHFAQRIHAALTDNKIAIRAPL